MKKWEAKELSHINLMACGPRLCIQLVIQKNMFEIRVKKFIKEAFTFTGNARVRTR